MLGRNNYVGYAVDWIIELVAAVSCMIFVLINGSLYIGLCLYINAMVADMKTRLATDALVSDINTHPSDHSNTGGLIGTGLRLKRSNLSKTKEKVHARECWRIYVTEIGLHTNIYKYFQIFCKNKFLLQK